MTLSLIIRDLTVKAYIGITNGEKQNPQRLCINATIELNASVNPQDDDMTETVDYDAIVRAIVNLAATSRFNLLETFAQHAAKICLCDQRTQSVNIRVEKLDLYDNAIGVGIACKLIQ